MSSRWIAFLLLPLVLLGCSFDTDDDGSKHTLYVAENSNNLDCIERDVVQLLDSGLEKFDEKGANKAFSCMIYALDIIDSHINVKNQNDIKLADVKKLVKKKVKTFSGEMEKIIDIFFAAKQKTVKGKADSVSHKELKELKLFLNDFRYVYVNMYPTFELMGTKKDYVATPREVSSAISKFRKSKVKFKRLFANYKITVTKKNLEDWLAISDVFEDQDQKNKWELYWSFHNMMWNEHNTVSFENVDSWYDGIASVFTLTIKNRFSWTLESFMDGKHTADVFADLDQTMSFLQTSLSNKKNQTISYASMNKVIYNFINTFDLPRGLSGLTLKKLIPLVIEKLIGVPIHIRTQPDYQKRVYGHMFKPYYKGFNTNHFLNLNSEYQRFKAIQMAVVRGQIKPDSTLDLKSPYTRDIHYFTSLINEINPYFPKKELGLYIHKIDKSNELKKYNLRNLSLFNLFSSFGRAVAMGYTSSSGRDDIYEGIMVSELTRFIAEFEDFFSQIYIMEKRGTALSVAERIYLEAKLFVGTGDGYKITSVNGVDVKTMVSFVQSMEVMANYSSGMYSIDSIFAELKKECDPIETYHDHNAKKISLITFGQPGLVKACFKEHYLRILSRNIKNLPGLQNYIENYLSEESNLLKNDGRYNLVDNLIYSGQEDKNLKSPYITYADISIIGTFVSFIESVFLKFDLDYNGFIENDEVTTTFDYLKEFIEAKGFAECSGVQFRHLLLYKSEGTRIQKIKTGTSCLGSYLDRGFRSSKGWFARRFEGIKDAITDAFSRDDDKGLDANERAARRLLKEAEAEIRRAAKQQSRINGENDLSVDREDILQILSFMKRESDKQKSN